MNTNFIPFMRSIWPQKLLLMLWVNNGKVMWSESVVTMTNKASLWSRVSWPMAVSACCWIRGHSCYQPRRTGERKCKSVWGCFVDANLSVSQLRHYFKKDIPELTNIAVPHCLGPKKASRIHKLFSLSKEDDVCQYVVRKPPNEQSTRDSASCCSTCLPTQMLVYCFEETAH